MGHDLSTQTLSRRGEIAFALVGFPLAVAGGLFAAAGLYLGGLLAITLVGLPLVAGALRGTRALGTLHRRVVLRLLDQPIADPPGLPRASGPLDWVKIGLTDGSAWKTLLYLLVRLPVALLTFAGGVLVWVYSVFLVATPVVWLIWTRDDMAGWMVPVSVAVGLVGLGLAPWTTRATANLNRWLARALLAPSLPSERQLRLEQARNLVAADAAATLRRIERDLHDGTQARLVAIGLNLALADEALGGDAGQAEARERLSRARAQVGEATTELRRLTRGINPVALDRGLDEALPTLAADAGIPIDLHIDLAERPGPVAERTVYFCVAELITNAAKHSGADSVRVDVTTPEDGRLRLEVHDDGAGGARVGAGSGLRGLRERVESVDGRLTIASPPGGPTVISVDLPVTL